MGKSPNMREDYFSPEIDREKETEEHGAPALATKSVYIGIAIVVVILLLLVVVGLHIPTGE